MNNNYFKAIATMVGTILGVGIFSIPFVIAQSGILPFLILLPLLAFAQYVFHKLYAEIIIATGEKHRMPGYVAKYFGEQAKYIVLFFVLIASYGSMLAYVLVGGSFLHQLLFPVFGGSQFLYTTILYIMVATIVLYGLKLIAKIDALLAVLLLLTVVMVIGNSLFNINLENYQLVSWPYFLLPYGPIFFAVGGDVAIPEVCRLLDNDRRQVKKAIIWGTFVPAAIIFSFVLAVVGVSGGRTSPDTLAGLASFLPLNVIKIALAFGLMTITTAFLSVAESAKETYVWDLKINKKIAWALALSPAFILYLLGVNNLTSVVSFTGSITGGILGITLIWLFFKVKNSTNNGAKIQTKLTRGMAIFLSFLFVAGFIYSLIEAI